MPRRRVTICGRWGRRHLPFPGDRRLRVLARSGPVRPRVPCEVLPSAVRLRGRPRRWATRAPDGSRAVRAVPRRPVRGDSDRQGAGFASPRPRRELGRNDRGTRPRGFLHQHAQRRLRVAVGRRRGLVPCDTRGRGRRRTGVRGEGFFDNGCRNSQVPRFGTAGHRGLRPIRSAARP